MTVKTISSKAKTSTTKTKIRKKKSSDVKEDCPLTDFSEKPVPQNINHIEIGDFVKLGRSMVSSFTGLPPACIKVT